MKREAAPRVELGFDVGKPRQYCILSGKNGNLPTIYLPEAAKSVSGRYRVAVPR